LPETIIKQTIKKNEKVNLLKFSIGRAPKGVEVRIESSFIEDFFKNYGLSEGGELAWNGSKPYNYPRGIKQNFEYMLNGWKQGLFVDRTDTPNLSMLRAVGLSEGKTFVIDDTIYSDDEIKKFPKIFQEQVTSLFKTYMKPVNVSIDIVFSINESD